MFQIFRLTDNQTTDQDQANQTQKQESDIFSENGFF